MWSVLNLTQNGGRERAMKEMIARFEKENPGVKIQAEAQAWFTLPEKFVMAHSSGQAPDVAWVNGENLGLLINSGVGADLDALFLNKWKKEDWDDILIPYSYDIARANGKRVGVPLMLISQAMMYRRDLFRQAGIDPNSIRSWDDLTEAAKKLTVVDPSGRVTRWGLGLQLAGDKGETAALSTAIIGQQGHLFGKDCKPELATPAGERAVQMHVDWIKKHKVSSQETLSHSLDDMLDHFAAGRNAIVSSGIVRYEKIKTDAAGWDGKEVGIAPWPSYDGKKPSPQTISGWFAVVSKDSPNKELAAKFVEFITNKESTALWTDPGGQVPLRKSTWQQEKFKDAKYDWMRTMANFWQEAGYWPPPQCNVARTYVDLNQAVHQVLLKGRSPTDALKDAEKATLARQK